MAAEGSSSKMPPTAGGSGRTAFIQRRFSQGMGCAATVLTFVPPWARMHMNQRLVALLGRDTSRQQSGSSKSM